MAKPASSRWSSFADVLSPAQRSLCSAAAAPRSMGQRSVENGQHGHTVDSTVPCRARRPGLIADQLHIHSLCRRRCWSLLCMCLISVRWTAVCHDATVFTSVVPVDDPVDLRWTPVCNSVLWGASVVAGACSACGGWTAVCHDAQLITRESGIGVLRRMVQSIVHGTPGRLEVLRRHRLKLASMHAKRE